MLMNEYETTVILKPDLGGDDIKRRSTASVTLCPKWKAS